MPSYQVTPGTAKWLSARIRSRGGAQLQLSVELTITLDDGTVLGPEPRAIQVPDIRDDPEALAAAVERALERTARDEQRRARRRPRTRPALPTLPSGKQEVGPR